MTDAFKAPKCERCGNVTEPQKWNTILAPEEAEKLEPHEINLYACRECGAQAPIPCHCERHDKDLVLDPRVYGQLQEGRPGDMRVTGHIHRYRCPDPGCDVWIRVVERPASV